MKNFIALAITGLLAVTPAIAKDKHKETSLEDAIVKEIFNDDDDKHNGKHGDPGAHGRANAAEKQSSHGKGSKKGNEDLEDVITREVCDEDDKDGKHKKKTKK
jgi:hypothetical protein